MQRVHIFLTITHKMVGVLEMVKHALQYFCSHIVRLAVKTYTFILYKHSVLIKH